MTNAIAWLCVGALVGWLESQITSSDRQQGTFLNIVIGGFGALIAGFFLSPILGVGTIRDNNISVGSVAVSLLGAVIVLAVVNFVLERSIAGRS